MLPRVTAAMVADGISAAFASELPARELQAERTEAASASAAMKIMNVRFRIFECTYRSVLAGDATTNGARCKCKQDTPQGSGQLKLTRELPISTGGERLGAGRRRPEE